MTEPKILDTRSGSSMSDAFSESLCIERLSFKKYRLFLGGYEFLGEISDFVDEETGEENIPDMIGSEKVQDYDGQYIYGGSIVQNEDDGEVVFQDINAENLHNWLKNIEWHSTEVLSKIEHSIKFRLAETLIWQIKKLFLSKK